MKRYKLEQNNGEIIATEAENGEHLIEEMARFVGSGFTPEPIKSIEIKPYDFTVEDELD